MGKGHNNTYVCPRGHRTVTVALEDGVTPFMLKCRSRGCNEFGQSSFFADECQREKPTHEWYKPDLDAEKLSEEERDHVERGGLLLRIRRKRKGGA